MNAFELYVNNKLVGQANNIHERSYAYEQVELEAGKLYPVRLDYHETINDAEELAGLELRVPVEELAALPAGMFYHHDLVGCAVVTGGGEKVGTVEGVEGTLSGSRLVVAGAKGEILVPLATEICRTIDVPGRRIVIEPPEGLLDLNTSR